MYKHPCVCLVAWQRMPCVTVILSCTFYPSHLNSPGVLYIYYVLVLTWACVFALWLRMCLTLLLTPAACTNTEPWISSNKVQYIHCTSSGSQMLQPSTWLILSPDVNTSAFPFFIIIVNNTCNMTFIRSINRCSFLAEALIPIDFLYFRCF